MNWTSAEFKLHNIRKAEKTPEGQEHVLRHAISHWLDCHGWWYFAGRPDKPTRRRRGEPDFIIPGRKGITYYVEVKTATGELRPEQEAFANYCIIHGHRHAVVRTFAEFLRAIE